MDALNINIDYILLLAVLGIAAVVIHVDSSNKE